MDFNKLREAFLKEAKRDNLSDDAIAMYLVLLDEAKRQGTTDNIEISDEEMMVLMEQKKKQGW